MVSLQKDGFNSVVDFLFPATFCPPSVSAVTVTFQFRCGFSVPCDTNTAVSKTSATRFQFRCGFSVPCDTFNAWYIGRPSVFQFRCGFSVPCDSSIVSSRAVEISVSIPLWIFCSLRRGESSRSAGGLPSFNSVVDFLFPATSHGLEGRCHGVVDPVHVSIPLWIFCSLRPVCGHRSGRGASCFNSVVDFLFPATSSRGSSRLAPRCFNSVVDFLFPATSGALMSSSTEISFQFRCGFSVPCDRRVSESTPVAMTCFNSVVDFLFPATRDWLRVVAGIAFQFRCGFSVPCDATVDGCVFTGRFQFRCGFSVPCDKAALSNSAPTTTRFNSVVDFLFPATRLRRQRSGSGCFNSVVDFLFPATQSHGWCASSRTVSIPLWIFCSLRRT